MTAMITWIRNQWFKPLIPFTALGAAYNGFTGVFNPFVTLWLKDSGLDLAAISILLALQPISRLFAPYFWGLASDKSGARVAVIRIAAFSSFLFSFGLWVGNLWFPVLALTFLLFFSTTTVIIPLNEAAMAHWLSLGKGFDFRGFGRSRLVSSIAFLVAVCVAGHQFSLVGTTQFPYVVTTMLLLMVCVTFAIPVQTASKEHEVESPNIAAILKQSRVRLFLFSTFFHLLSLTGFNIYLSLYLDSLGYDKTFIGITWAASIVMEVFWFFNQGKLFGRLNVSAWLLICSVAAFFRLGLTATFGGLWPVLLVAQALHAITYAAHHSACTALLNEFFPGRARARGQALYTVVAFGFAGVLGIASSGWLGTRFGLTSVFYLGMGASMCAALLSVLQLRTWLHQARSCDPDPKKLPS